MSAPPFTPRRSARGAIFTPTPQPTPSRSVHPDTTFHWTSSRLPPPTSLSNEETANKTYYNSFTRITSHTGATPRKGKGKARAREDERRFTVGDGVIVDVEGGNEGVGVLIRLWEEDGDKDEEGADEVDGDDEGEAPRDDMRMMGEVHWCFRRQDLPGVMKNLSVDDNEVLLAASPNRSVTTPLPISLLVKTLPIYSQAFFNQQQSLKPSTSAVKGWSYVRTGVYWCERALDKGARGGKVWGVDVDAWRVRGKGEGVWEVPSVDIRVKKGDAEGEGGEGGSASESEEGDSGDELVHGDGDAQHEEDDEEGDDGEEESVNNEELGEDLVLLPRTKRKLTRIKSTNTPSRKKAKTEVSSRPSTKSTPLKSRSITTTKTVKGTKKMPHPKSSTSHLPSSVPSAEDLPVDPYGRALMLLHVGATPESLPCREEEFVDVLGRVEEGVESGGGGCLYIAGVPGTGKTATVHAVVKELKRKAQDGELTPFSYVEINGLKIPSPQHAYVVLWEAISGAKGCSAKTALRGLEAHFGKKTSGVRGPRGHTFVILMDELDQLLTAKQDVVYNFFNWPTMRDSQLYVIAVANRMDLPQHLAAKIKSRLGLQTVLFQPYDRTALIEIVQSRLIAHPKSKAEHKVLLPDAIALAATKMAGTNGDARRVLDACRRAVEVTMDSANPHPVTPKEMMQVLNLMSSSPVALFLKHCSQQQKMMMAALVRCVRREGVPEIPWRSVRTDHDALTRSLLESNDLLSGSELALVFTSLVATHAVTWGYDVHKSVDDRKVALGMEIGEVGRVLMGEGDDWRRALAGT